MQQLYNVMNLLYFIYYVDKIVVFPPHRCHNFTILIFFRFVGFVFLSPFTFFPFQSLLFYKRFSTFYIFFIGFRSFYAGLDAAAGDGVWWWVLVPLKIL